MTVRQQITLLFALALCGLGAGCGGGDSAPAAAEVDDPYFRQGQQLVKQGRTQEALSAYLKAIERRGDLSSAESHLEAGVIYLNHSKDPIEAYHHFRLYLSQQPNSRDAPRVRALLDTAKKELITSLRLDQPFESQGARTDLLDQIERLKRDNEALTAELATLRASAAAPIPHAIRAPAVETPSVRAIVPDTPPIIPVDEQSPLTPAPAPSPVSQRPTTAPSATTAPASPPSSRTTNTTTEARSAPARPGTPAPAAPASRRHTVVQGDSLYGLAKKYYGAASNAKADAIFEANRDVMKNKGDLRPGMELKIP